MESSVAHNNGVIVGNSVNGGSGPLFANGRFGSQQIQQHHVHHQQSSPDDGDASLPQRQRAPSLVRMPHVTSGEFLLGKIKSIAIESSLTVRLEMNL